MFSLYFILTTLTTLGRAARVRGPGPLLPSQDEFYTVPPAAELAAVQNGDILRWRTTPHPISALGIKPLNLQGEYQALYKTVDSVGADTATVLSIMVPHNANMSKLLSYQVAEDAAYLDCAPSYALQLGSQSKLFGTILTEAELALIDAALQQGWVVVAPDHEGPRAAWLARANAAHAILDGIRAATRSGHFSGIESTPTIALWGYSGGGITSTAALELRAQYAPELTTIVGAALGGLAPDIRNVITTCNKGPYAGIIVSGIMALCSEFPALQALVDSHLRPEYKNKFERTRTQCVVPTAADWLFQDVLASFDNATALLARPDVRRLLEDNNLGGRGMPDVPVFIYKGVADDLSPVADTDALVDYYCAHGAPSLQYYRDLTADHGGMAVAGAGRAVDFLHAVMNGEAQPSGCHRETVASGYLDIRGSKHIPSYVINLLLDLLGKPVGTFTIG
ncbi:secretory lipase [Cordyceps militaris]|uniref:Secretory lipase n=1 Tax=Cordyceps militaris TaxID=73501 RepID=A0A2H4SQQ8_CORMI|nr:secretory lipase [Cordyceps militaris]